MYAYFAPLFQSQTDFVEFKHESSVERRYSEFRALRKVLQGKGAKPLPLAVTRWIPSNISRWEQLNDFVQGLGNAPLNEVGVLNRWFKQCWLVYRRIAWQRWRSFSKTKMHTGKTSGHSNEQRWGRIFYSSVKHIVVEFDNIVQEIIALWSMYIYYLSQSFHLVYVRRMYKIVWDL